VNKTELAIKTIKECGLNIQQVADKLGVHRNQIHRWLKGNTVIRDSNLFEIGKMIGNVGKTKIKPITHPHFP